MFLHTIKSEGLSHLSYLIGSNGEAAVIDPRRDCEVYVELARQENAKIGRIFETHRNEDYIIGSVPLAEITGAEIHHGKALAFAYGSPVSEGEEFSVGKIKLKVLETPGHTMESISIALFDTQFGDEPVAVFTGDALFIGDVGRTDFFPDRAEEVAGMLYDSIFKKILPLGDQVILYPAHGKGSVCGDGMADREFSTLGYENKFSPALQITVREAFIRHKVNERHTKPPYFKQMERRNMQGDAPILHRLPIPGPMTAEELQQAMESGAFILDTRSPESFGGAFIPGSISIPMNMISSYAGWFIPTDADIVLITETPETKFLEEATRQLIRIGYDRIIGYLAGSLNAWTKAGKKFDQIGGLHAEQIREIIQRNGDTSILDVRKSDEYESGHLPGAKHVFLGELPNRLAEIDREKPVITFCGSGRRAMIAASILKRNGFPQVSDNYGSMDACHKAGCPIEKGA